MEIKLINKNGLQLVGKKETVLINPDEEMMKKSNARIVIFNQKKETGLLTIENRILIVGPGEYEVGGVEIMGTGDGNGGTVYTIVVDGVTVAVMGQIKEELSDKKLDKIGSADVLMADISQNDISKDKMILKLAKGMGVNYLLPIGSARGEKELTDFLDASDSEGLEAVASLKTDKDSLPEGLEVVLLHE
ncbi:MAG: MBL fold metallo-hydrolase [Microgenomates group bacterium]